jgi:hypothetical protein
MSFKWPEKNLFLLSQCLCRYAWAVAARRCVLREAGTVDGWSVQLVWKAKMRLEVVSGRWGAVMGDGDYRRVWEVSLRLRRLLLFGTAVVGRTAWGWTKVGGGVGVGGDIGTAPAARQRRPMLLSAYFRLFPPWSAFEKPSLCRKDQGHPPANEVPHPFPRVASPELQLRPHRCLSAWLGLTCTWQ